MPCAEASVLRHFLHVVTKAMFYKERVRVVFMTDPAAAVVTSLLIQP